MKSSQRIRRVLQKYQRKPDTQQGILGNEVGVISVPNRTDYVYVRVAGLGTIAVYNKRVPLIQDLPVDVGYDPLEPKNFQVLNIHRYPQGGGRSLVDVTTTLHGSTHGWSGIDPVYIEKRQLMPLRPTPMGGMNIYVTREVTYYDDKAVLVTGQQLDLAPYVPTTGSWLVLLYKDTDELIKVSTGGALKDIFSLSLADAPQVYPGTVPIALVRLYGGQTGIAEGYQDTDLIDVRQLFSPIDLTGTSGGGGHVIQDEGVSRTQRTNLNFKGALVWAIDNAGADSTDIIISGASSGISTGIADHDHSGDTGDGGQFPLVNLQATGVGIGLVPLADGIGGIDWGAPGTSHYFGMYNYWSGTHYYIGSVKTHDLRSWIKDLSPAFALGAGGSFDDDTHAHPNVINVKGVIYCYYGGYDGALWKIGLARSFDHGATFVKYGVVLSPDQAWENNTTNEVNYPKVVYDIKETDSNKRFKMWYNGGKYGAGGIGYAYSADGLTWTKYTSNPVLTISGSGWESYYLSPGAVFRRASDWVLVYSSSSTVDGAYGSGVATFSNPESLYVKSASNPIIAGDGITSAIGVNIGIGDTQVTVADATVFPIGAPVWVYDSGGNHYLTKVVKQVSATVLLLADASPYALTVANSGTVRSVGYNSLSIEAVYYDGGYRLSLTAFIPGGTTNLRETAMPGWMNDDLTKAYLDYAAGLLVPISLDDSKATDVSSENLNYCDLWQDFARFEPRNKFNPVDVLTDNGDLLYNINSESSVNQATPSRGASATANKSYTIYTPDRAIDGSDSTSWLSYNANVVGSWLKIDLGASKTITGWRMLQSAPITYEEDARSYRIESSNDGSSWSTVLDRTVLAADETVNFAAPVTARYFRFTALTCNGDGAAGWTIWTLELYGIEALLNLARLPIGTEGDVLTVVSGLPSWEVATAALVTGAHTIMDEGATLPYQPVLNFIGNSLWAVNNAGQGRTDIIVSGTSSGGGHIIENEGSPLTQRSKLNFVGASVDVTDDAGNDRTIVTVNAITGSSTGDVSQYGAITAGHVAIFHADKEIEDGGVLLTGTASGVTFHGCKAYSDATFSATGGGTATYPTFNQEEYDTDAYHATGAGNTKITIPAGLAGYYLLEFGTYIASAQALAIGFYKGGTTKLRGYSSQGAAYMQVHSIVKLAESEYVEVYIWNGNTTVNIGHATMPDAQSWFAATFLGA